MAIQMRRGNKANLDKTKLVAGEIAVSLDTKEVSVSDGNGDTIDLATKDDLQNIIKLNGGVTIDENTLVISPEEETTEEQGTPVDIESISIDGGMTDNPIKDATARADISSVGGRVTTLEGKIGANNGIATLNGTGKVPESQLPSYVDDVIEGYLYNGAFYEDSAHTTLITGESGKIYVDLSTDKTYRWTGTVYVCTGSSLELGETQGTAYEGSKGKANADNIADIQSVIPANASTSNKLATMEDVGDDAVWGSITGTLSDQTDLKTALDNKYDIDDTLYGDMDDNCYIPYSTNTTPKSRKVTFGDFRNKITNKFYTFLRETVGFTTKNIADTSKAEIGVRYDGRINSKYASLVIPCKSSTSYRVSADGTKKFTNIVYTIVDSVPPPSGSMWEGITNFPRTITTGASDKYIVFEFKKSTDVTQSDVDALKIMVKESSVTDNTYEPYHPSVEQTLRDAEIIEGKNLLEVTTSSSTIDGITYTIEKDSNGNISGIDVNGTATATSFIHLSNINGISDWNKRFPNTDLVLTGCPRGGSENTYQLDVMDESQSGTTAQIDIGAGVIIPAGWFAGNSNEIVFRIRIQNGFTCNHIKFHPMLCTKDEWDKSHDFEPYYIPLKDSKFDRSEQRVLGAKNRLIYPYDSTTKTEKGITFTDNGDGSITLNGTSTDDWATFNIKTNHPLKKGRYLFSASGFPSGNTSNMIRLTAAQLGTGVSDILLSDSEEKVIDVPADFNTADFTLVVRTSGTVCNNVTIYPMLRLASDPDSTYAPYAMTNRELTELATVQESAVTDISSGTVPSGLNKLSRQGRIVNLVLQINNITATTDDCIFKIPQGFRPPISHSTVVWINGAKLIKINADGDVIIKDTVNNAYLFADISWITS